MTDTVFKQGLLQKKNIQSYAESGRRIHDQDAECARLVPSLSGGNQQKVVIARVFKQNPDVLIVAQPTRGVDVGAMEYIHHQLPLTRRGKAILLISADLDEVRSLSDRIAVIYGSGSSAFNSRGHRRAVAGPVDTGGRRAP
ncbi:MAG: ATP-binding cassette domain-containing protein [Merdibacter sp.]